MDSDIWTSDILSEGITMRLRRNAAGSTNNGAVAVASDEVFAADGEDVSVSGNEVATVREEIVTAEQSPEQQPEQSIQQHEEVPVAEISTMQSVSSERVKWGEMVRAEAIRAVIDDAHKQITTWQKNFFEIPRNAGVCKELVDEITRLVKDFNLKTPMERVAIPHVVIILPLLLQKPSRKSKSSDHTRNPKRRMKMWKEGKVRELLSEGTEIQKTY